VSVYGTVPDSLTLEILSRRLDSHPLRLPVGRLAFTARAPEGDLPPPFTALARFDRDYHPPAGLRLTRHPFETIRGTGI
jgi:hypothetical protein